MAFDFATEVKRAFLRRLVYVLIAVALAWCGIGRAEAQETCPSGGTCNKAQAYQACLARKDYASTPAGGNWPPNQVFCVDDPSTQNGGVTGSWRLTYATMSGTYGRWFYGSLCPAGETWNDETKTCEAPKDCASEPDLPASSYTAPDTEICSNGCKFAGKGGLCVGMTVDAQQQWYCSAWEATGAECSAGQGDTPISPSDSDGDGSSDGNDTSPNNPGQGGGGKDGKPQEDGGGKGDGNGPGEGSGNGNTSGGGGNCASPPSSSGDAILAQIAYQTWATRCAIEGAKDGNGNLKTTQGGSGTGTGGDDGSGDGTDFGTSNPGQDEEFDPSTVKRFGIPVNTSMLDSEAIFGGGTCPVLTVTIYGNTFSSTEIQGWCDLLGIMRALILVFGAFTALRILMGNAT